MGEVWKDIPGWEGCYRISDQGNLFSCRKNIIQTVSPNTAGYPCKTLYDGAANRRQAYLIHRLVMMAFGGAPTDDQPHVNHKDGNKLNNAISNLEWCSPQQNTDHAWETGLMSIDKMREYNTAPDWHLRKPGDEHPQTKWSDALKDEIRTKHGSGTTFAELMRGYPEIPKSTLWSFISGRRK